MTSDMLLVYVPSLLFTAIMIVYNVLGYHGEWKFCKKMLGLTWSENVKLQPTTIELNADDVTSSVLNHFGLKRAIAQYLSYPRISPLIMGL